MIKTQMLQFEIPLYPFFAKEIRDCVCANIINGRIERNGSSAFRIIAATVCYLAQSSGYNVSIGGIVGIRFITPSKIKSEVVIGADEHPFEQYVAFESGDRLEINRWPIKPKSGD